MNAAASTQRQHAGTDPASLWEAFGSGADGAARERIITHYLRFARMLAAKMYATRHGAEVEFADYLQYARIGLVEAVDRFDAGRGVKFETFAASRINGAMLNGLASFTEMHEQIGARKRIAAERLASLKQPHGEGADALFGYLAELAIGLAVGFTLDDSGMAAVEEPAYQDNTYSGVELKQLRARIRGVLDELPGSQRQVITYHYLQQLTLDKIAVLLELSTGRIAQIHRDALDNLRKGLRRPADVSWSF